MLLLLLALGAGLSFRFDKNALGSVARSKPSVSSVDQDGMARESNLPSPFPNRGSDQAEDASPRFASRVDGLGGAAVWRDLQSLSPAELRGDPGRLLMRQWGKVSPRNAVTWAGNLSDPPLRDEMIAAASLGWAESDLDEALDWVLTLPQGEARNKLLIKLGHELVRTNPEDVINLAEALPQTLERDHMMTRAAAEWAVTNGSAALTWARQVAEPDLREQTLASVAVALSEQDPEAAANVVTNELTPGRLQDDAVVSIVQRWVQNKPEGAAAWVSNFSDGPLVNASVEHLVKIWSLTDAPQVQKWILRLPAGFLREQAFSVYRTNVLPKAKAPD